ncbi:DUF2155 domain-containing protein [Geobacter sulfurreducens]|uniref:Lipoprotein, putative n=2 Tax=Geobacter sulfurreducens TaxID=35554 RepID=Q74H54_GEOSL|nr:DUF2155 domain-containing protein [Geobacter sulfurreducens]AAR33373.1 lipoprotein, putative [Geobacter sulfurreducens PCA]ADI82902.1 lipoprotein, putative [Geobacter sulfurreducens KN400]QVW35311.1 DUF2155 domain-containing protein [Geobacter sulfurreducens]UTG92787.1 DUF2155 domain-containing protein [Geobacter sulfurreducens]HBB69839.1 DUF2155 domain-containing protein [Geobacter sulfurreducens]
MKVLFRLVVVALTVMVAVAGCSKKEEQKAGGDAGAQHGQAAKKESVVVVPDNVKGKWKSVKIAVTDKAANKESVYTINVGAELAIPESNLTIAVDNFLPHFTMDGTTLTSQSNEPKNPAAQIRILEGGKEVFKGWLFSLYPTTHAFNHPKYGFTLVDFIPAN